MCEVSCDKSRKKNKRCGKKAYVEVYFKDTTCGKNNELCRYGCTTHWAYLCFKHFILDLIENQIMKSGRGYCYVSNKASFLERLFDKRNYEDE